MDSRNSAEVSDNEQRQSPNAVASTSKENDCTPPNTPNSPSPSNRTSETSSPNLVIEYKDMQNELSEDNVQGIVSLRRERKQAKSKTRLEALERLMPRVELHDINKIKKGKGHFEPK